MFNDILTYMLNEGDYSLDIKVGDKVKFDPYKLDKEDCYELQEEGYFTEETGAIYRQIVDQPNKVYTVKEVKPFTATQDGNTRELNKKGWVVLREIPKFPFDYSKFIKETIESKIQEISEMDWEEVEKRINNLAPSIARNLIYNNGYEEAVNVVKKAMKDTTARDKLLRELSIQRKSLDNDYWNKGRGDK